jgi:hypothetical protein
MAQVAQAGRTLQQSGQCPIELAWRVVRLPGLGRRFQQPIEDFSLALRADTSRSNAWPRFPEFWAGPNNDYAIMVQIKRVGPREVL